MRLTVNNWFDDDTGEHVATKFYIQGEECSLEDYEEMYNSFGNEYCEEECDGYCEDCEFNTDGVESEESGQENQFLRAVTDEINDILEMFENPTTCNDCKCQALMGLVMLGVDGALQGCIGKKDEKYIN